jgi:hypothetical protein
MRTWQQERIKYPGVAVLSSVRVCLQTCMVSDKLRLFGHIESKKGHSPVRALSKAVCATSAEDIATIQGVA